MPMTPRSNSSPISPLGIFACSSISRTSGRMRSLAKSRTLSRRIRSSSVRSVSGCGTSAVSCIAHSPGGRRFSQGRTARVPSPDRTRNVIIAESSHPAVRDVQLSMRATLSRPILIALLAASLQAQQPPPNPPPPAQNPPAQQPPAQPPPAAQDPQKPQPPTFKSGINFVRVDVIVTDGKGNPMLDLKPEEFSVFEDGKPQKIESFSVVKIDPLDQTEGPTNSEIRN